MRDSVRCQDGPHGGHSRGAEGRGVRGGDNTGGLRSTGEGSTSWVGGGQVSGPALESCGLGKEKG